MRLLTPNQSHEHSLKTLNALYEYDDFMASVGSMIDLGCGSGQDLEWWATRTTRDESMEPLNIRCTGVDQLAESANIVKKYSNINFQQIDFEQDIPGGKKFSYDLLWCHDAFQYCIDPLGTLAKWRQIAATDAMLVLILPQTTNVQQNSLNFSLPDGVYFHHTLVNLIYMLAVTGWDCASGFFFKAANDPWLHAIVYNSVQPPRPPKTTTWYQLCDSGLLPDSAIKSVMRHGFLRQQDLVLPWLDKNLYPYAKH